MITEQLQKLITCNKTWGSVWYWLNRKLVRLEVGLAGKKFLSILLGAPASLRNLVYLFK
jgi:hypothetical protein